MKGDFHIHTTGSDGMYLLDLILESYKEKGYTHLAITDHYVISDSIRDDNIVKLKIQQYGINIIIGAEPVAEVNDEHLHLLCYFNSNKYLSAKFIKYMEGQENFVKVFNERIKSVMKARDIYSRYKLFFTR